MLSEEQPLKFEHVLFFCTRMDRIPPYTSTQKTEVEFEDVSLPWASYTWVKFDITNCYY